MATYQAERWHGLRTSFVLKATMQGKRQAAEPQAVFLRNNVMHLTAAPRQDRFVNTRSKAPSAMALQTVYIQI